MGFRLRMGEGRVERRVVVATMGLGLAVGIRLVFEFGVGVPLWRN